ncbi:MAG: 4'-phosphopantetheinyl transferase superfamily protein [Oligoflexales bacterium]|nr:4'-phosphopantetheinyl transferase superfamily protein [Oligoflexales bacterium]
MRQICRKKNTLPIGVDIIDIHEQRHQHPRFASRVLSGSEYLRFQGSSDPGVFLLKAWAAKEAAYKYFTQIRPGLSFIPCRFVYDDRNGQVIYDGDTVFLNFEINRNFVFCLTRDESAWSFHETARTLHILNENFPERNSFSGDEMSEIRCEESLAVRMLAKRMISRCLRCGYGEIAILKGSNGIPKVFLNGSGAGISLSFSHHGRFAAAGIQFTP